MNSGSHTAKREDMPQALIASLSQCQGTILFSFTRSLKHSFPRQLITITTIDVFRHENRSSKKQESSSPLGLSSCQRRRLT